MIRRESEMSSEEKRRLEETEAIRRAEASRQVEEARAPEGERRREEEAPQERAAAERRPEEERKRKAGGVTGVVVGGSAAAGVAAIAAIVLTLLGLFGVVAGYMLAISAICIGAALIFQGSAVAAHLAHLARRGESASDKAGADGSGAMLGGGIGVVLGILALFGIAPMVLMTSAVLVFGVTLLIVGSGAHVLAGIGALVIGGMALLATATQTAQVQWGSDVVMTLSLVALLVVACAIVLSSTAIGGRLAGAVSGGSR